MDFEAFYRGTDAPIAAIYSSPLERAMQTAGPLARATTSASSR